MYMAGTPFASPPEKQCCGCSRCGLWTPSNLRASTCGFKIHVFLCFVLPKVRSGLDICIAQVDGQPPSVLGCLLRSVCRRPPLLRAPPQAQPLLCQRTARHAARNRRRAHMVVFCSAQLSGTMVPPTHSGTDHLHGRHGRTTLSASIDCR